MGLQEQTKQSIAKSNAPVLVTQPYVPSLSKYMKYVEQAFNNRWLTNDGPLLKELTQRLTDYLGVKYLLIVNNGTTALQLAYKVKGLEGKTAITTPFTFPATSTALKWQGAEPKLADINSDDWNLSPNAVREILANQKVGAIVPVNIFGAPCDLQEFEVIGKEHDLPIIYDSAQAMLAKYKNKNIFAYGDIHCISFHATKLFHCVEGGALTFSNKVDYERAKNLINFGIEHNGEVNEAGINGKMSELHAAMGLCVLDEIDNLIELRANAVAQYTKQLRNSVALQQTKADNLIPPMYMPIKLESEEQLFTVKMKLEAQGYLTRRYFYPNDNKFQASQALSPNSVANQTCDKILCLPLMHDLSSEHINKIVQIIKKECKQ